MSATWFQGKCVHLGFHILLLTEFPGLLIVVLVSLGYVLGCFLYEGKYLLIKPLLAEFAYFLVAVLVGYVPGVPTV